MAIEYIQVLWLRRGQGYRIDLSDRHFVYKAAFIF